MCTERSSEVEEEARQGDEGTERKEGKMIKRSRNFPRLKMKIEDSPGWCGSVD